jgi:glyoxylase-like metal-dependent hydrolase (beta-lactamase superfamily II)
MTKMIRTLVSPSLLLILIASGVAQAQLPSFLVYQETEDLGDGLYAFRQNAYRSIFLVTDDGVIATDPVSVKYARDYRDAIAEVTDQPVRFVVYSQSQWDRTRGGELFKKEGAVFIAHEKCLENLRNQPHPDVIMPEITYSDTYKVELGGRSLELHYFGPAHDTCLSVMVAKPANMVFVTNVVNPPDAMAPWNPTIPNNYPHNYIAFFKSVEALADREGIETLIGGFMAIGMGPDKKPMVLSGAGPVSAVRDQRIFWELVMSEVKAALDAGIPPKQMSKKIDLKQFSKYPGYSPRIMDVTFRRIASMFITGR